MSEKNKDMKITVLMGVYYKDNPLWLEQSIESIINQTLPPDEYIILEDGKLTEELENVLHKYEGKNGIKIVRFEENRGLGPVLADGVCMASNGLIARMDADDVSDRGRFALQVKAFEDNPKLSIVGGAVREFLGEDINYVISNRNMPETNEDIYKYAHKRNPFAHPTVMFKKEAILKAGNYRKCELFEDYDLWVRVIKDKENECYNVPQVLVNMRVNDDFYKRRGGLKYIKNIIKFKYRLYKEEHFYSFFDFVFSAFGHAIVALVPSKLKRFIYMKFLRKESTNE